MKVYAVFQDGIYRHLCAGIFDTEEAAKACADETAKNDLDDYHDWEVVPFELNDSPFDTKKHWKGSHYREPLEAASIYSVSKTS